MSIWSKMRQKTPPPKGPALPMKMVAQGGEASTNRAHQPQESENLIAFASECNGVVRSAEVLQTKLSSLQTLHYRALHSTTSEGDPTNMEVANLSTQITAEHKRLVQNLQKLESHPVARSAQYAAHLGRAGRSVRDAMRRHAELEGEHRQALRVVMERQYRIVRPDADEEEVKAACEAESGSEQQQQIFAQALLRGSSKGTAAKTILGAVEERHEAIVKVEKQLEELAELFQVLAENVAEQGYAVVEIEGHVEDAKDNVELANVELVDAIDSARKTRRKKWICFWISVAIVVVIIAGIALIASGL